MANQVNVSTTTNTVSITPQDTTNVNVGTTNTSVNVTQGSTSVVQVTTQGPQGPVGPQGPAQNTGSLLTTASANLNTLTFTKGDSTTFPIVVDTGSTPTLDQVLNQGSSSAVNNIILTSTTPFNLTNLGSISTDTVLTYFSNNGLIGKRDIDPRVFDDTLVNFSSVALPLASSATFRISIFSTESNKIIIDPQALTFTPDGVNPFLTVGTDIRGKTIIGANSITASIISASTEIIGDIKRDSFTRGFFRTTDGITNRSSYFLEADINDTTAHSLPNYISPTPISSSQYYKLVIPCDDMSTPISLDISGVLRVQGAITPSSPGIKIDVYTASMTPNSLINDPLTFNRAFIGDTINLNSSLTTQSIHVTQSFDISSLSSNSFLAIALSNASTTTAVTTEPNGVSISLKISRNYKKEN